MKGIVVKTETGYYLWRNPLNKSQEILGATVPIMNDNGVDLRKYKLSLKNCQAIENGYDLDELARDCEITPTYAHEQGFITGFQKALEILGDKKFSEDDVISMIRKSRETGLTAEYLILAFQQTEWDVEIEMICPHPEDTYRCGMGYGCDADGCNHPNKVPYLDKDGCLILKRK